MNFQELQKEALKELDSKKKNLNTTVKNLKEGIEDERELDVYEEANRLFYRVSTKIANTTKLEEAQGLHMALTVLSQAIYLYDKDQNMARRLLSKAKRISTKTFK